MLEISKIQLQGTTYTLVDSTVPSWARGTNKPTYTATEVGAATAADIQSAISDLVNSAPTTLDTLNELATALGNDPNFATTVAGQIGAKYTKPSTGIPKTDLASDVQTSLGKADTAIQSADLATVATTGSYNDLSNKPTIPQVKNTPIGNETDAAPSIYWVAAALAEVDFANHVDNSTIYVDPDGDLAVKDNGVTYSKLSSAVQASLDNADNALPSANITSDTLKAVSVPNVTSVGTASTWSFTVGTGNDANTLIISGSNSTAPTLGTAISAASSTLTGGGNAVFRPVAQQQNL